MKLSLPPLMPRSTSDRQELLEPYSTSNLTKKDKDFKKWLKSSYSFYKKRDVAEKVDKHDKVLSRSTSSDKPAKIRTRNTTTTPENYLLPRVGSNRSRGPARARIDRARSKDSAGCFRRVEYTNLHVNANKNHNDDFSKWSLSHQNSMETLPQNEMNSIKSYEDHDVSLDTKNEMKIIDGMLGPSTMAFIEKKQQDQKFAIAQPPNQRDFSFYKEATDITNHNVKQLKNEMLAHCPDLARTVSVPCKSVSFNNRPEVVEYPGRNLRNVRNIRNIGNQRLGAYGATPLHCRPGFSSCKDLRELPIQSVLPVNLRKRENPMQLRVKSKKRISKSREKLFEDIAINKEILNAQRLLKVEKNNMKRMLEILELKRKKNAGLEMKIMVYKHRLMCLGIDVN